MEKALNSCRKFKKQFILGPAFKILEAIFELITPFLMRYIINVGVDSIKASGNYLDVLIPGLIIVGFCILGFCSTIVCQYFASIAAWGVGEDVRNRLFKKITNLSLDEIENVGRNNLVTVVTNDVPRFQTAIAMAIRLALRAPCLVIGSLICSFIINWRIALVYLAIIPLISIIYFVVLYFSSKQIFKIQEQTDNIVQVASDSLSGMRVIKAFNKEEDTVDSFKKYTGNYFKESKTNAFLNAIINPVTFFIVNIAITLVVYFSSNIIINSNINFITSGDLVALVSYLNQILVAMVVVCNLVVIFTKAFASNKRINNVFALKSTINNDYKYQNLPLENGESLFKFSNVGFGYNGGEHLIVEKLNFEILKGQTIGIIGGTGSGKTTIVKLLERFYDTSCGEIDYKKHNIKDYDVYQLRNEIGLASQKSTLFKGTIRSNLLIGKSDATEEEMIQALKDSCAYEFVSKYDDFLDHVVEENGKNFSGGQKQRLNIARALITGRSTLIFDDSTSALDFLTEKTLRNNLKSKKDLTTIYITQRISTIQNCDLIIVMYHGTSVGVGKHEDLLNNCQIYKEIYESQTRNN